jgi:hypothetical protein
LIKTCAAVTAGLFVSGRRCNSKETKRRKFIRAFRIKNYPGPVKAMPNILKQGKWSG